MSGIVIQRVKERLAILGLSEKEASHRVAGNPSVFQNLFNAKKKSPSLDRTERIAKVLECSVAYLVGQSDDVGEPPSNVTLLPPRPAKKKGRKPGPSLRDPRQRRAAPAADQVALHEYDLRVSAGGGANITREEVRRSWGFPRSALETLNIDPSAAALVEIAGDSMHPTLRNGDLVLIDLRLRNPAQPGVYVLWDANATVCKRLERKAKGHPPSVRIISDNPQYSTYEARLDQINVIGRVVWFGRRAE